MGEARPRFGSRRSADVKIFLVGPDDKKYEKNPVYLHSQILKSLRVFEGKFSSRWSPVNIAAELWVTTHHNFDHYLKCIEIVYGEPVEFLNIEECLAILSVAADMWADECINKCMQYLEAVPWSAEEESQIRKVLSFDALKLKISPDLAARLNKEDEDEHINFVETIVREMVSVVKQGISIRNEGIVETELRGILSGNASRDFVDGCGRVLVQEFKSSIDSRDFNSLERIFKYIKLCNGGVLEAALNIFCEDAEFMEYVKAGPDFEGPRLVTLEIIMWLMNAIGDGKVIISRNSRVSLLTTWLPIIGTVKWKYERTSKSQKYKELDEAVVKVVQTLSPGDKKRICVVWAEVYRKNDIDMRMPISVSKSL